MTCFNNTSGYISYFIFSPKICEIIICRTHFCLCKFCSNANVFYGRTSYSTNIPMSLAPEVSLALSQIVRQKLRHEAALFSRWLPHQSYRRLSLQSIFPCNIILVSGETAVTQFQEHRNNVEPDIWEAVQSFFCIKQIITISLIIFLTFSLFARLSSQHLLQTEIIKNNVNVVCYRKCASGQRDIVLGKSGAKRVAIVSSKFLPTAICNEAVEMQMRLHFLRTYETYPQIIQARPIVRIHSIFRLYSQISPCVCVCNRACVYASNMDHQTT